MISGILIVHEITADASQSFCRRLSSVFFVFGAYYRRYLCEIPTNFFFVFYPSIHYLSSLEIYFRIQFILRFTNRKYHINLNLRYTRLITLNIFQCVFMLAKKKQRKNHLSFFFFLLLLLLLFCISGLFFGRRRKNLIETNYVPVQTG